MNFIKNVAATLMLAGTLIAGGTGCVNSLENMVQQQQKVQQEIQRRNRESIKEIKRTTHCIRKKTVTKLTSKFFIRLRQNNQITYRLAMQKSQTFTRTGFGSGFAFRKIGDFNYILTAKHVLEGSSNAKYVRENPLGRMEIESKILKDDYYLVDNRFDKDPSDDIKLEVILKSKNKDYGMLRTKDGLYISDKIIIDPNTQPKLMETIYNIGFPLGFYERSVSGKISAIDIKLNNQTNDIANMSQEPGISGSPYFFIRPNKNDNNQIYFGGIVVGGYTSPNGKGSKNEVRLVSVSQMKYHLELVKDI